MQGHANAGLQKQADTIIISILKINKYPHYFLWV